MQESVARTGFGVLCLAGVIAVATVALIEIVRMRRGHSLLSIGQFRLRLLSALIWMVILGSLSYATLFLWPQPGDRIAARQFLAVVSGAILLFIVALFLLAYDLWQLSRQRRLQEAQFNLKLAQTAQEELQRARLHEAESSASTLNGSSKSERDKSP